MRRLLAVALVSLLYAAPGAAQAPAPARRAARAPAPAAMSIQVTDSTGRPLGDVHVTAHGPLAREGVSAADGTLRFINLRAGTYRLHFEHEDAITLERDVTIRAGESPSIDVSLSAAPPPPTPVEAPPPPPSAPELGPPAEPAVVPIPSFLEKNFIGRDPRKESRLGCTTTGGATLIQTREALLNQTRDDADEWLYVVAGEGTLRLGTGEQRLAAGTFALVPHTVGHGIVPAGRNPLIFVSVLSGAPCGAAAAAAR